jgi:multiple sugar transport system substrate-binding protein
MGGKPGLLSGGRVTRREVIKRALIVAAGLTLLPAVVAACKTSGDFLGHKLSGRVSIGSSHSNPADKAGMVAVNTAFAAATGLVPTLDTIEHGTCDSMPPFSSCDGTSDDVFTWFSGYRMRFFADKGLVTPIDDVWALVSSDFTAGFAKTVTCNDGKVYGIPVDFYPWCMFYRKSLFAARGYKVPATWTELLALCARMKKDKLTPVAFGDKDGWEAMGTFDILNLRLNGYDFHIGLMTGKEKWTDAKVTAVFEAWRKLVPYYTAGFAGLTWQTATDALVRKTAGMFYLGLFLTDEVAIVDKSAIDDIDFFPFPSMGNSFDAEQAIEAPVDIWMVYAKSSTLGADLDNAKAYLEFWARGSTQLLMYQANNSFIPTASDIDTSKLDVLSRKAIQIVRSARKITQFMDRDTRPDFAGANAMQNFLLKFLEKPGQDLAALQKSIQDFWDGLPSYDG